MVANSPTFFHHFQSDITALPKPQVFTFPFCYEPDELSKIAAEELQAYLEKQQDFTHNFGLQKMEGSAIGKMFGVLVVENEDGQMGYLAACSGKLAGTNQHTYFVPPIFDMLIKESFFLREEEQINALNRKIETLEGSPDFPALLQQLKETQQQADEELRTYRLHMKEEKTKRKKIRTESKEILSVAEYRLLETDLIKQSYRDQHEYAVLKSKWKGQLESIEILIQDRQQEIESLKSSRKLKSAALQQRLFEQYQFLNAREETKNVLAIFAESKQPIPPAGAGECAAPKLLQYAYQHQLKPICMAEFWWGVSPSSEVRKHKNFYPACKSKCEPILSHMLKGLQVAPNPMRINPAFGRTFDIIHEDHDIIVINKPSEFLSVPGIHITDSVYTRILEQYPEVSGPVIIHRLDMSTSGILLVAKHKDAHQFIQQQFIQHTIIKRYTAILDGLVNLKNGLINLPLRVDLDDRPRQVVCYKFGKPAQTKFEVLTHDSGLTRIHFFPLTGRTHQLRVHAAHHLGLHTPILGDDLYGQRANRLHLHAGHIQFVHPRTGKLTTFTAEDPF
ncbi:RluA family pseudouridine synthase [Sphingobacterium gobiense]|uniref:RNA pseudouridine synthase n=1 Tax=Sphingobacterium gobiense TaxID=1382456 RepID=A0A2S9JUB6_9SPHI|nr:RluA family pseudouridine synthase [Sphingobacterium gobiense]PRD56885.1 RNA pseudouridine synthase [Sphingobacterium gobiense]